MKYKFLLLLFISVFSSQAQNTNYDKAVKHFLEINGTMGQYHGAVNEFITMLKSQYKDAGVSDKDWEEVQLMAENSLTGLSDDLVVIYKKFFTFDEIKELNKLFEKEIMQKFINNVVNLSDASQEASVVWSRSLYNKTQDFLQLKGYTK